MFFIAYTFNGQVCVLAGQEKIVSHSIVLQDKCNIKIFWSPVLILIAYLTLLRPMEFSVKFYAVKSIWSIENQIIHLL